MNTDNIKTVDMHTLNSAIEFDCPFLIVSESQITDAPDDIDGPTVILYTDKEHNGVGDEEIDGTDWVPVTGYSGQHGYSGPVMHASEFLGGGMARDVLEDVGAVYVVTAVECMPAWEVDEDNEDDVFLEAVTRDNPAGWMLLKLKGSGE